MKVGHPTTTSLQSDAAAKILHGVTQQKVKIWQLSVLTINAKYLFSWAKYVTDVKIFLLDRDRTALEAAQSRLDAIEAKTAEATLIHAQAINNLAASIDRMSSSTNKLVDLIGRVPKKVMTNYC